MDSELLAEIELDLKQGQIKRQAIAYFVQKGYATIVQVAKHLILSVPTTTKLITELVEQNVLKDYGKLETPGGRYPVLYGLNPEAGYFIGVDVRHASINIAIIDFLGNVVQASYDIPFQLENRPEKMDEICADIDAFIEETGIPKDLILNVNINLPGRINPKIGMSYTLFNYGEITSTADQFAEKLGVRVTIDNDTRAMAYGEFTQGYRHERNVKNVLYLNISWGIGLGLILGGEVYLGRSGFSGEFGHTSVYDNQILCPCGKKGCLETEVSGSAFHRNVLKRIEQGEGSILAPLVEQKIPISLDDLVRAANQEDILCLEVLSDMGRKLGKQVASLINIFNPEVVVIGGTLSLTGDYLTQAVQTVVRTYSLNLVNRDTDIITAQLGEKAGVIGASMLARTKRFSPYQ